MQSTTVRPCSAASAADEVDDVAGGRRVEARRRLVEEQHVGVVEQRPGEGEPLALAGREALHEVVGAVGHAEALEQLGRAPARRRPRPCPRIRAVNDEVLGGGEPVVEPGVLGEHAGAAPDGVAVDGGVEAEHRRPGPASGRSTPLRRRTVVVLPAPFGPSRASTSPGGGVEGEAVEGDAGRERAGQPLGPDGGVHRATRLSGRAAAR